MFRFYLYVIRNARYWTYRPFQQQQVRGFVGMLLVPCVVKLTALLQQTHSTSRYTLSSSSFHVTVCQRMTMEAALAGSSTGMSLWHCKAYIGLVHSRHLQKHYNSVQLQKVWLHRMSNATILTLCSLYGTNVMDAAKWKEFGASGASQEEKHLSGDSENCDVEEQRGVSCYGTELSSSDVWLTVHRNSVCIRKPTGCHFLYSLFLF